MLDLVISLVCSNELMLMLVSKYVDENVEVQDVGLTTVPKV